MDATVILSLNFESEAHGDELEGNQRPQDRDSILYLTLD
jgi:hypothetical protein